jgi:hypothetical protein
VTEARDILSQLTQLPAASTLAGDTRTQVNGLIANFNELITNQTDWRASYTKVEENLNALIGPEDPASAAGAATGTAGAVGTSGAAGAATLDPAVRAKLVELRAKLTEFETAMGGAATAAATSGSATASAPTSAATPAGAAATDPQTASPAGAVTSAEAMRHIAAIEAILNGTSAAATGTAGTSGTTTAPTATAGEPLTLSRAQVEQLRTHLSELRKILDRQ